VGTSRVRLDAARFWAGAGATAVVAALIALVGILISRWTLNIPILAPTGDGAWGSAHTAEYVLVSVLITVVAAGVLYLLVLGTPQPTVFFGWIMGLATLAAVVYPFSTSAPLEQKAATAIVDLVLGIAIWSLLIAVTARAIRRPVPPAQPPYRDGPGYPPRPGYVPGQGSAPGQGYGPAQGYGSGQGYDSAQGYGSGQGYPPGAGGVPPTQPINVPQDGDPRRRA
jgi:hypothetical protein